jgi:capsular exopolysaccharide synthesis family protein
MSVFIDALSESEREISKRREMSPLASAWEDPSRGLRSPLRLSDGTTEPTTGIEIETQSTESMGLDEIFSRLWQRRITLLCFAALGLLLGAVVTALRKPVYRAMTTVRLESPTDAYPKLGDVSLFSATESAAPSESYVQNELKILQSESLALRVANRLDKYGAKRPGSAPSSSPFTRLLAYFHRGRPSPSADDLRIKAVQGALTVRSSLKSQVVEIYFDSSDPERAALGANAVVSEYVAMNRDAQSQLAQDTTAWLSTQISDLKTKLDQENQQLKAFAGESGLIYSANQSNLTEQRVSEIQEQLTKAQGERAARQSRYETAVSNPPESLPDVAENNLLREYEGNLVVAERDLIQFRSMYTPKHYKVIDAESRVAQLQSSIQRERQHVIERMGAEFDSAARLQRSLEGTYRNQTRKLESQSADAFSYSVLKHELDKTQQLYDSLLQKAKEAGVASALHTTSVRLIDVARPPADPYSPNLPLNGAIGLAVSLFLGLIMILVQERGSSHTQGWIESRVLKVRELGTIPEAASDPLLRDCIRGVPAGKREEASIELITWHTQSLLAESYRSALTSIMFSPGFRRRHCVLAVTSVEPQEGKTTTITNLGIALAETRGRVLLIDGDVRRPGLHRVFGQCNDTGLTTLLSGDELIANVKIDELTHPTNVPGLFILPSGPGSDSITPLLHSARIVQFLARVRQEFDLVLIDTPPTSLFSDARLLGRLSDSVIFVCDGGKTSRQALNTACLQFVDDGTSVLGTIRNRSEISRGRQTYGYYQSYGAE